MAVPKYNEFFPSILNCLSDGNIHTLKNIREYCISAFSLSENDQKEQLESGQNLLNNRINWAKTYLKKAGLIESTSRAKFILTSEGKKVIQNGTDQVTLEFLKKYDSFYDFFHSNSSKKKKRIELDENKSEQSPKEMIDSAMKQINSAVADCLMQEILKMEWYDFEKLVVKLLPAMGYGEPVTTKKSGDDGIDGLIKADKFGFDTIYVQAKQWQLDSTITRPDIQKFLGALVGQGASKGLFITTARFSKEAILFTQRHLQQKIILVDGNELTKLMIEYNLGVSIESTLQIKRIDYDFFSEGL